MNCVPLGIGAIGVAGNGVMVGRRIGEGLAENAQQSLEALHVPAGQLPERLLGVRFSHDKALVNGKQVKVQ
jgi:hypothetical protein